MGLGLNGDTEMTFEFSTRDFLFSHGKEPRGYGSWAFEIEGGPAVFAPTSTYAEAKKWAKARAREMAPAKFAGHVLINVCS